MHYYDKVAHAARELNVWLINDDRPPWSAFCQKMLVTYGFDEKRMRKTLRANYPDLDVEDDKLVKVDG